MLPPGTINAKSPGGASASIVPICLEILIAKPTSRPLSIKLGCWVLDETRWDSRNVLVRASEVAETGRAFGVNHTFIAGESEPMRLISVLTMLLAVASGLAMKSDAQEKTVIARNGVSTCTVVVSGQATAPAKLAAKELAHFLNRVTGADFDVANQYDRKRCCLLVGPDAAKFADPKFTIDALGDEGLIVQTRGKDLILAGGTPRGTLYAVFTFLEDVIGCRWWSSKASTIPRKETIELGTLNVRYTPIFEYREAFWSDAFDGDWAMRNKCNGKTHRLDENRGGRHIYEGFVHTFDRLIPPDTYFDKHPEWFSLIDGKRTRERTQICLTSEAMRQELVKNLKANLRANPAVTIASVSQNDWAGMCECSECRAVSETVRSSRTTRSDTPSPNTVTRKPAIMSSPFVAPRTTDSRRSTNSTFVSTDRPPTKTEGNDPPKKRRVFDPARSTLRDKRALI